MPTRSHLVLVVGYKTDFSPSTSHLPKVPCVQKVLSKWLLVKERKRGRRGRKEGREEKPPTFLATMLGPAYTCRPSISWE